MKQSVGWIVWWCSLTDKQRFYIIENAHDGYIKKERAKIKKKEEIPKLSEHTHKLMKELAGGIQ